MRWLFVVSLLLNACADSGVMTLDATTVDTGSPVKDAEVDAGGEDAGPADTGDAGQVVDSGDPMDSGASDVGAMDAAEDAMVADAGGFDVGSLDVGGFDGAIPDIGGFDGGIPDIGGFDGGIPDIGSFDGGLPDFGVSFDGSIPDVGVNPGNTLVSIVPGQTSVYLNLQPPVPADPLVMSTQLRYDNQGAAPELISVQAATLSFGLTHFFFVGPDHLAPVGVSTQVVNKTPGSGTPIQNASQYCGATATMQLILSNLQILNESNIPIFCVQ